MATNKASMPPTLSVKGNFAHPMVTGRTCPKCHGPTLRLSICGLCAAVQFGMTDEQIHRALEVLTDPRGKRGVPKPRHAQT